MPAPGPLHQFTLPYTWPNSQQQEHENWVALERWANTFGQSPYDAPFFNLVCDGTLGTYTFNVPNIYSHLWYLIAGSSTTGGLQNVTMGFNGDVTDADYFYSFFQSNYSAAGGTNVSSNSRPVVHQSVTDGASRHAIGQGIISNYTSAVFHKTVSLFSAEASAAASYFTGAGLWDKATPITSVTLTLTAGNFTSGSRIKFGGLW